MARGGPEPSRSDLETFRSRVRGCLLGGAIGDALGGPVEFWKLPRILGTCGDGGVRDYVAENVNGQQVYGRITDDTLMTLFAVEGIIRAMVRTDRGLGFTVGLLHHAQDRWLDTQNLPGPDGSRDGWLINERWLYSRRAPGNTCLSALTAARAGERRPRQFGQAAVNDSKGCGGVMRSAPFGFLRLSGLGRQAPGDVIFTLAAEAAGHTHGHPTGQIASGALALLVHEIVQGRRLAEAVERVILALRTGESTADPNGETLRALQRAVDASTQTPSPALMESLGGGWIAEEALAMAVHAALVFPEPEQMLDALAYAVTHGGDSDSTGAICGNILGALHGESALPAALVFEVEGRGTILQLADDLVLELTQGSQLHGDWGPDTRWTDRYPGW